MLLILFRFDFVTKLKEKHLLQAIKSFSYAWSSLTTGAVNGSLDIGYSSANSKNTLKNSFCTNYLYAILSVDVVVDYKM